MHTWRNLFKLAIVAMLAAGLAFAGTSAAAGESLPEDKATPLTCGNDVFLDGLRAIAIGESGHDEVFLMRNGVKIWPTSTAYVSMAAGQRVEVDKCVPVGSRLELIEYDTWPDGHEYIGSDVVQSDTTRDFRFCCAHGNYRLGGVA
ncbi:hypothetical protein [Nonomuraea typhae]|uniref:hypothetical protein n=1 Tax=Nonomuraea typhae TaxID=2603600 RepID=UPI0012FC73ED|nr:hypothetical protein [Nonomuraea typhae]